MQDSLYAGAFCLLQRLLTLYTLFSVAGSQCYLLPWILLSALLRRPNPAGRWGWAAAPLGGCGWRCGRRAARLEGQGQAAGKPGRLVRTGYCLPAPAIPLYGPSGVGGVCEMMSPSLRGSLWLSGCGGCVVNTCWRGGWGGVPSANTDSWTPGLKSSTFCISCSLKQTKRKKNCQLCFPHPFTFFPLYPPAPPPFFLFAPRGACYFHILLIASLLSRADPTSYLLLTSPSRFSEGRSAWNGEKQAVSVQQALAGWERKEEALWPLSVSVSKISTKKFGAVCLPHPLLFPKPFPLTIFIPFFHILFSSAEWLLSFPLRLVPLLPLV